MKTPPTGLTVGISISESPDLATLGLGERHLTDAMTQIARHLLAAGSRLVYGGDLREGGFTELLFEFVSMHHRPSHAQKQSPVTNVLAWPVHIAMARETLASRVQLIESLGIVMFLKRTGGILSKKAALQESQRQPTPEEWSMGLTRMRTRLTTMCDARIVLGGRVDRYQGVMPGIAEEALLSIQAQKPTYLIGGFGGCVGDIVTLMNISSSPQAPRSIAWNQCDAFTSLRARDLHNGLTLEECQRLATTKHIDEIVTLLLRGLARRSHSLHTS